MCLTHISTTTAAAADAVDMLASACVVVPPTGGRCSDQHTKGKNPDIIRYTHTHLHSMLAFEHF